MDKGRLLALTDGIIAIAATIMVLELEIPDKLSGEALLGQLPTIMAYIISFLQIWIVWHSHHDSFRSAENINDRVFLLNVLWVTSISEKYHKSVAQVILRWHIQEAHIVFPKSTNPAHIRDNMNIFDFTLTEEDMKKIRGIDKNKSYFNNPEWLTRFVCRLSGKRL